MKNWATFLKKTYSSSREELNILANNLINMASLKSNTCVLDAGAGIGLISENVLNRHKNIKVFAVDNDISCIEELNKLKENYNNLEVLNNDLKNINLENASVNNIFTRSTLMHCTDKLKVLKEFFRILKPNSQICLFEVVFFDKLDRYYEYLPKHISDYNLYKSIEEKVRNDAEDPLTNYDVNTLREFLYQAGFKNINILQVPDVEYFKINNKLSDSYIFYDDKPHKYSLKEKFLKYMTPEQFDKYYNLLEQNMKYKTLKHKVIKLFIFAQKEPDLFDYIKLKIKIVLFYLLKLIFIKLKIFAVNFFSKLICNIKCNFQKFMSEDSNMSKSENNKNSDNNEIKDNNKLHPYNKNTKNILIVELLIIIALIFYGIGVNVGKKMYSGTDFQFRDSAFAVTKNINKAVEIQNYIEKLNDNCYKVVLIYSNGFANLVPAVKHNSNNHCKYENDFYEKLTVNLANNPIIDDSVILTYIDLENIKFDYGKIPKYIEERLLKLDGVAEAKVSSLHKNKETFIIADVDIVNNKEYLENIIPKLIPFDKEHRTININYLND